jgi:predicted RNase H-like nuclease (RuvC/YqgF family)
MMVQKVGKQNSDIFTFIIEEEYARLKAKQEIDQRPVEYIEEQQSKPLLTPSTSVEELQKEHDALLEERNQLIRTKQDLSKILAERIENRKMRINKLKTEISEMKQQCEYLQETVETYVQTNKPTSAIELVVMVPSTIEENSPLVILPG